MDTLINKIQETITHIQSYTTIQPKYGIILGTGLGNLAREINIEAEIDYESIPNFPTSTVESHTGKLIFGTIENIPVVAMQGRFHYYEGYDMKQITFPVRVMKYLGIERLFISNASGSLRPEIRKGTLLILDDHINLYPENPLRGKNDEKMGARFPDMSQPYDRLMIKKACAIAAEKSISINVGTYVGLTGPNLETKAEYRYLKVIGGDVVGMSTVPEVIVANHMNIPVFAVSVVTDEGFHKELQPLSLEEVIAAAMEAEPMMTMLLKEMIVNL